MTRQDKINVFNVLRTQGIVREIDGKKILFLPPGISGLRLCDQIVTDELDEYIKDTFSILDLEDPIIYDDMDKYTEEDISR